MSALMTSTPVVMSITNHDPSGGAGISADIETLTSLGCHCTPIITKLSAQDTEDLKDTQITETGILISQIRAVLEDIEVDLIKIGDVADIANAEAVHTILSDYPEIPVVLHASSCISEQQGEAGNKALSTLLFPQADLVLLNKRHVNLLAPGSDTLSASVQYLMEQGCESVVITDTEASGDKYINQWFSPTANKRYEWPRLNNKFHGAGSTLSAALSAYLAHGLSATESIQQAQQFTFQALQQGRRVGMGSLLPDRLHWCRK